MPAAGLVAALGYLACTRLPTAVAAVVLSVALLALAVAVIVSLRRAPRAADLEPADGPCAVGLRPGMGSVIEAHGGRAHRVVLQADGRPGPL
jgi:hypothetical protein